MQKKASESLRRLPPSRHPPRRPRTDRGPRAAVTLPLLLALLVVAVAFPAVRNRPLRADVGAQGSSSSDIAGLAPCGASPGLFPSDEDDPEAIGWRQRFRDTVAGVVQAETENVRIDCTDDARVPASDALRDLAGALTQWKGRDPLYSSDAPAVLLDYFEAYACALKAKGTVLPYDIAWGAQRQGEHLYVSQHLQRTAEWFERNERELDTARETLRRTLLLLMGQGKLDPLGRAFTCFNRASKDLRNILGLLGEASACTPVRTWDARTRLRQFSPDSGQ